jgi:hypothetical protein
VVPAGSHLRAVAAADRCCRQYSLVEQIKKTFEVGPDGRGPEGEGQMRRTPSVVTALTLVLGVGPAWSADPPTLEGRAAAIERVSTQFDGARVVIGHISRKLRMPSDTLQAQRKQTGLGWGELLIANRLSKEKELTFAQVVAEFRSGKSWEQIARDHRVDLERLRDDVRRSQEVVEQREEDRPPPAMGDTQPRPSASTGKSDGGAGPTPGRGRH